MGGSSPAHLAVGTPSEAPSTGHISRVAQSSLVPTKPRHFDDPAKAREAGKLGGQRPGTQRLTGEFRDLRQQQILDLKLRGWTLDRIAEHFGVSTFTIKRELNRIKSDGVIAKFERKILNRLVPKAVMALEKKLDAADDPDTLGAIKEVMKLFGASQQQKHQREIIDQQHRGEEDDLAAWARKWEALQVQADTTPPANAIDTTLIDDRPATATACNSPTESACTNPPAACHEATGEACTNPSGPAGPGSASGQSSAPTPSATGPCTSQIRLGIGGTEEGGFAIDDADRGGAGEVEEGV